MALNALVDLFLSQSEKCGTERVKLVHSEFAEKLLNMQ